MSRLGIVLGVRLQIMEGILHLASNLLLTLDIISNN